MGSLGSRLAVWPGMGRSTQDKHCSGGRGPNSEVRLKFNTSAALLTPSLGSAPFCCSVCGFASGLVAQFFHEPWPAAGHGQLLVFELWEMCWSGLWGLSGWTTMTKFRKRSQVAKGLEWGWGVSGTTLLGDIGGKTAPGKGE